MSATLTTKLIVPPSMGVPLMVPPEESSSPAGSDEPDVRDQA